jgi:hypothetical protein
VRFEVRRTLAGHRAPIRGQGLLMCCFLRSRASPLGRRGYSAQPDRREREGQRNQGKDRGRHTAASQQGYSQLLGARAAGLPDTACLNLIQAPCRRCASRTLPAFTPGRSTKKRGGSRSFRSRPDATRALHIGWEIPSWRSTRAELACRSRTGFVAPKPNTCS